LLFILFRLIKSRKLQRVRERAPAKLSARKTIVPVVARSEGIAGGSIKVLRVIPVETASRETSGDYRIR